VTLAPLARQIRSLVDLGIEIKMAEVHGPRIVKYPQSIPSIASQAMEVDVVHAHYCYCGWIARLCSRKPMVVSFMGDDLLGTPGSGGSIRWFSSPVIRTSRWLAQIVDAVIVKSSQMAAVVAPVQVHVVPNGVDLEAFRPVPVQRARSQLGWTPDRHYVLFPGDPHNVRKGFDLANAVIRRASQFIAIPIEIIKLVDVRPEQVPLIMNASDAMLMTSMIEGSPNVVKEAMACDLPIVSVPVGDVADLLAHVEACEVRPYRPEMLAEALLARLRCGGRSTGRRELERRGLDLASVANRIVRIYEEVLGAVR
jgi:glycosyltransferase involved in cell wall biosynthesis